MYPLLKYQLLIVIPLSYYLFSSIPKISPHSNIPLHISAC